MRKGSKEKKEWKSGRREEVRRFESRKIPREENKRREQNKRRK